MCIPVYLLRPPALGETGIDFVYVVPLVFKQPIKQRCCHRIVWTRFILTRIEPCGSGFGTVNTRLDGQRTFCQVARIRPTTGHPHDRDESHNFNAPSTDTVIFHESSIGNAARSYLLPALSL